MSQLKESENEVNRQALWRAEGKLQRPKGKAASESSEAQMRHETGQVQVEGARHRARRDGIRSGGCLAALALPTARLCKAESPKEPRLVSPQQRLQC